MKRVRGPDGPPELSDRARKALQLANQEAHRLNHPAVGPEHLLLGLVKEGGSRASAILRRLGYDLVWLRSRVERMCPPAAGARMRPGVLPSRDDLAALLADVTAAGRSSDVRLLTPDHLLAALASDPDGPVARILGERSLALWCLRRTLRRLG